MVQEAHEDIPPRPIEFGRPALAYYQDQITHHRQVDLAAEIQAAHDACDYEVPQSFQQQIAVAPDQALDWTTRVVRLSHKYTGLLDHQPTAADLGTIRNEVVGDVRSIQAAYRQLFGRYHHEVNFVQITPEVRAEDLSLVRGGGHQYVEQWRKQTEGHIDSTQPGGITEMQKMAIWYVVRPELGVGAAERTLDLIRSAAELVRPGRT